MFAFLLPEIVIEVAYMTVEAFLLSGIVSGKQSYSTRSTVNGEGVLWEKGKGGSQNKTTSSLIYVSDAS